MKESGGEALPFADMPAQQAAAWFARLRADDVTQADKAAFDAWLRKDFEHHAAYARFERLWSKTGAYANAPAVARIVKDFERPRRRWLGTAAAAVVGLIAIGTAIGYPWWRNHRVLDTTIGERETLVLSDGSQVTLNTNSQLTVEFSDQRRLIRLDHGQAYFKVAKDTGRPFEVLTRSGVIRALGTSFEVYQQDNRLLVTLVEGRVAVSGQTTEGSDAQAAEVQMMHPGERLVLEPGASPQTRTVSVKRSTAWLSGRLVFEDEPLGSAVAEANRYSRRQIFIREPGLEKLRIGGVYRTDDVEKFVHTISSYFPIEAVQDGNGDYMLRQRKN